MSPLPKFVDMARSTEEIKEESPIQTSCPEPIYPYGLCISFSEEEIEKLDLDEDAQVGDYLHIHALAKVTSVSSNQMSDGENHKRIEMQLTHIAAESEDEENEMADNAMADNGKAGAKYGMGLYRPRH